MRILWLAFLFACLVPNATPAAEAKPSLTDSDGAVRYQGSGYRAEWISKEDLFQVFDAEGRRMMRARLQPEVMVAEAADARRSLRGALASYGCKANTLTVTYTNARDASSLTLTAKFDPTAVWFEPVQFANGVSNDIVELRYFSINEKPNLACGFAVIPGINETIAVSPIVPAGAWMNVTGWLGRGGPPAVGLHQQWGLPVHYFCGFEGGPQARHAQALGDRLSDAFCMGLADLPAGDLYLKTVGGTHSLIVSVRSDLWHHLRGPAPLQLGSKLVLTFGRSFRDAIQAYYARLLEAGIIETPRRSHQKEVVMATPQFNTWAEQVATDTAGRNLTQQSLAGMYDRLHQIGMRPGMFVIDDQWEGTYGNLEHSSDRLPGFEDFLAALRKDGLRVGLWAAFMRCENPAELGLTPENMLRTPDGKPYRTSRYYLLDYTQPEVQKGLQERARRFVRRYHPDLVKFDFGYELPSLSLAAPRDMNFAGERMLLKGLQVVVEAMRQENPDIVLMYYNLSPLLNQYVDLHSPDDLFLNPGDYDIEANRRFYFSSIMASIGTATYGSGGYDWQAMPQIWFDSALLGALGSLQPLGLDERGESATPERISKYNGLSRLARPAAPFRIEFLGDRPVFAPIRGAHATSWARYESGQLVGVALRDRTWEKAGISSTAPVVVASQSESGLHTSKRLAIVPYGEGELTLKHEGSDRRIPFRIHLFGGEMERANGTLRQGNLSIPLSEKSKGGKPVEWIEINLD